MSDTKRLFIAAPLPLLVHQELQRIANLLKKNNSCQGTYTNIHDAHVTLQFLGSIAEQDIAPIDAALQTITYQKCFASLDSVGSFTRHGHVAIIYVDILSPSLSRLAQRIQQAIEPWLAKKEKQSFVAHVTLLRVKKIQDQQKLQSFLKDTMVNHSEFTIDSFDLMESTLLPEGPVHTIIKRYTLK